MHMMARPTPSCCLGSSKQVRFSAFVLLIGHVTILIICTQQSCAVHGVSVSDMLILVSLYATAVS